MTTEEYIYWGIVVIQFIALFFVFRELGKMFKELKTNKK